MFIFSHNTRWSSSREHFNRYMVLYNMYLCFVNSELQMFVDWIRWGKKVNHILEQKEEIHNIWSLKWVGQAKLMNHMVNVLFKHLCHEKLKKQSQNHILADHRMKVIELAETIGISMECVWNVLHKHLWMRKLCTRLVPHLTKHN